MAQNIGGFGYTVAIKASITIPVPFPITQFADDADPFDAPNIQIRDTAMGLNGDLLSWGKAGGIKITLNVIPDSDDDKVLAVIAEANRVGRGKKSVNDVISFVGIYPDGTPLNMLNGVITDAPPASSIGSAGRMKSKGYSFCFENRA